jgi:hypothetical protein
MTVFLDTSGSDVLAAIAALPEPPIQPGYSWSSVEVLSLENSHEVRLQRWCRSAGRLARAGVRPGPSHILRRDGSLLPTYDAFLDPHDLLGDVDLGDQPLVVLSYRIDSVETLPQLPGGLPWVAVSPQTAGLACHHPLLLCLPVQLHAEGLDTARILARFADNAESGHDCVGVGGLGLAELRDYANILRRLGLTAEQAWQQLEEACSPLDATSDNLAAFGSLPGGVSPEDIVAATPRTDGSHRWALCVLGENCD